MAIQASAVKQLREQTGAGMMDCKRALSDAEGDAERAIELLRERGLAKAVKRGGRETTEGAVAMALAGAAGALVELACETDFVAKTAEFQTLANKIAAAAAANPQAQNADALLQLSPEGESETLGAQVQAAIGKLGENIVLKRAQRVAVAEGAPGLAGGYIHAGGKLGVVLALQSDAQGAEVAALAKDVAMHITAADPPPVAIDRDGVPADLVEKESALLRRQAEQSGKPEKVVEKIVEGRLRKFYSEICLLEQAFIKDPDLRVQQLLGQAGKKLGAPVQVAAFARFRLGE